MTMRIALLVLFVACTKPNPNRCCNDEADCNANGIPVGTTCAQGLVCRGNQCIAEDCTTAAQCDPAAPYCAMGGCAEACTDDTQCPGFGQDANLRYCVTMACVECRTGDDCSAAAPICDASSCRGCATDDECPSRACDVDTGACLDTSAVLYADPSGSDITDCSLSTPCSITHAVASLTSVRSTIRMLPGNYPTQVELTAGGTATIIAVGATITDPAAGSGGVHIANGMNVTLRGMHVNATNAVFCENTAGATALSFREGTIDVVVGGQYSMRLNGCHAAVSKSVLNGQALTVFGNATLTVDRTNLSTVLGLANASAATITVTNSIFAHVDSGMANTTVDISFSSSKFNAYCPNTGTTFQLHYTNDLFVNDPGMIGNNILMTAAGSPPCFDHDIAYPQSMGLGTNMIFADPRVVDYMNNDFHLTATSPALNTADPAATDDHDFDGIARPQGAGRDLGAFELH